MEILFEIKSATINDVPILLSLIKELAEYERLSKEVIATVDSLQKTLFSQDTNVEAVIGYLNNNPIAFALFFHNYSTFLGKSGLYLEDLYVKPEYRSQGIGKKMLGYIARLAKSRNCGRFEWSVLDWNAPAINFYKKLGAVSMDEWTVFRLTGDALDKLAME